MSSQEAAEVAKNLGDEVSLQNRMWGDTNDRADISQGQLMGAALAQTYAVAAVEFNDTREAAFEEAGRGLSAERGQAPRDEWREHVSRSAAPELGLADLPRFLPKRAA